MKQSETKQKAPWPQPQTNALNGAPIATSTAGMKPIIRPSTRLGSRAQIPTRPAFLSKSTDTKSIEVKTADVKPVETMSEEAAKTTRIEPTKPVHIEAAPPQVGAAVEQLSQTREAKATERTEQITKLSEAVEKNVLTPRAKSLIRTITIPDVPMVKVVGHSVGGTKTIPYPSALPELSTSEINATLGKMVFIPLLALIATGVLGWNAFRQEHTSSNGNGEIVDHVSQHAMAPNRNLSSAYDDEPTRVRAKLPGIRIHNGPGMQFPVIGDLKAARLYPILEQSSNWIKIATDQTHFAWVDQSSVELIR